MKRIILIMLVMLFVTGFTACNGNKTGKNTTLQTGTLAQDETYTCKMHQNVMSEKPGKCPVCRMNLEKQKMTERQKSFGTKVLM
ncbi:hypothetical protein FW778_21045 [Ginsengibacter hankyongi]|uniref:Heavy metal binding domain-containing protein n=1 Tax=Ginsengibacter hankyongi TaxID=2607284 RepID=A0A5J5IAA7_9BACT|nr:heavy metal-binding domain-containing protein [Ginsengibacter hankyongi]KAA9035451.1 hypothetical protein FW778_21045 [Ginsengibacter hankyongi]